MTDTFPRRWTEPQFKDARGSAKRDRICRCGCGGAVTGKECFKGYIHGHHAKTLQRPVPTHRCKRCGGPFTRKSRGRVLGKAYCSRQCQLESMKARALERGARRQRPCPECGRVWPPKWMGREWQKYCSNSCFRIARARQSAPQEFACSACGIRILRGKGGWHRSDKQRRHFCSVECRQAFMRGAESPMWRGDSDHKRGAHWDVMAERIRVRDNHQCRRCGAVRAEGARRFSVDHIEPWRSFTDKAAANADSNLVTLCPSCHSWKTTIVEKAWLKGNMQPFAQYKRDIAMDS